jgi:NAD-dependent deacetylase
MDINHLGECFMVSNSIQKCKTIIQNAKKSVVLTGAGISTESGIPDFRSKTGIYQLSPEYILSLDYFYQNPKEFYQFVADNLYHPDAVPNMGHRILTKWEEEGRISHIITQNIDGLHHKAGSKKVIEFHGTMETSSCMNCDKVYATDEMISRMKNLEEFYLCNHCDTRKSKERLIKPDVVLFGDRGEWFTEEGFQTISQMMMEADCVLVLGTSLQVTPFSIFPRFREKGTPLIIINKGDTPYDHDPDTYVIKESIGDTLLKIDLDLS